MDNNFSDDRSWTRIDEQHASLVKILFIKMFFSTKSAIYRSIYEINRFQLSSTLRHKIFSEIQKDCNNILKVPRHINTIWVTKYKDIHFFLIRFKHVIKAMFKKGKKEETTEAKGSLNQFSFFNILLLHYYITLFVYYQHNFNPLAIVYSQYN